MTDEIKDKVDDVTPEPEKVADEVAPEPDPEPEIVPDDIPPWGVEMQATLAEIGSKVDGLLQPVDEHTPDPEIPGDGQPIDESPIPTPWHKRPLFGGKG